MYLPCAVSRVVPFGVLVLWCLVAGPSQAAGQVNAQTYQADVNVQVVPVASLSIVGSNLLYLEIPPAGSTSPANGVNFTVTGNANATVTAQPDAFVLVPTIDYPSGEHMGRAVVAGNQIGYRLRLDFPSVGMVGSPAASAVLPGYQDGPTTPPLSVNLMPSGVRNGRVHLEASPQWTTNGELPLPGVYVGGVTLTVTAF